MNDVRGARGVVGLTQDELALILGVSPRTVRRWEKGADPGEWAEGLLAPLLELTEREKAFARKQIASGLEAHRWRALQTLTHWSNVGRERSRRDGDSA